VFKSLQFLGLEKYEGLTTRLVLFIWGRDNKFDRNANRLKLKGEDYLSKRKERERERERERG
jgi:hypothetical protein